MTQFPQNIEKLLRLAQLKDLTDTNSEGEDALMFAARFNHTQNIGLLKKDWGYLLESSDLKNQNYKGQTALMLLTLYNTEQRIELLPEHWSYILKHSDLNTSDFEGVKSVIYALENQKKEKLSLRAEHYTALVDGADKAYIEAQLTNPYLQDFLNTQEKYLAYQSYDQEFTRFFSDKTKENFEALQNTLKTKKPMSQAQLWSRVYPENPELTYFGALLKSADNQDYLKTLYKTLGLDYDNLQLRPGVGFLENITATAIEELSLTEKQWHYLGIKNFVVRQYKDKLPEIYQKDPSFQLNRDNTHLEQAVDYWDQHCVDKAFKKNLNALHVGVREMIYNYRQEKDKSSQAKETLGLTLAQSFNDFVQHNAPQLQKTINYHNYLSYTVFWYQEELEFHISNAYLKNRQYLPQERTAFSNLAIDGAALTPYRTEYELIPYLETAQKLIKEDQVLREKLLLEKVLITPQVSTAVNGSELVEEKNKKTKIHKI